MPCLGNEYSRISGPMCCAVMLEAWPYLTDSVSEFILFPIERTSNESFRRMK